MALWLDFDKINQILKCDTMSDMLILVEVGDTSGEG